MKINPPALAPDDDDDHRVADHRRPRPAGHLQGDRGPARPDRRCSGLTGESVLFTIDGGHQPASLSSSPKARSSRRSRPLRSRPGITSSPRFLAAIPASPPARRARSTCRSMVGAFGHRDVADRVARHHRPGPDDHLQGGREPAEPGRDERKYRSVLSGQVVFTIDGQASAPIPLQLGDRQLFATLATSTLAAGTHTATASFVGNPPYGGERLEQRGGDRQGPGQDAHADPEGDPTPTPKVTPTATTVATTSQVPIACLRKGRPDGRPPGEGTPAVRLSLAADRRGPDLR